MSSDLQNTIHLFVDGNYLFFSARGAGISQDFSKLEAALIAKFGGEETATLGEKFFYTRPPQDTDPKAVLGWLKKHGWHCTAYNYATTHQDSLYVSMVSDMWSTYFKKCLTGAPANDYFVVVSGSGTLIHPISAFPKVVVLACVPESTSKRLLEHSSVLYLSLVDLL